MNLIKDFKDIMGTKFSILFGIAVLVFIGIFIYAITTGDWQSIKEIANKKITEIKVGEAFWLIVAAIIIGNWFSKS